MAFYAHGVISLWALLVFLSKPSTIPAIHRRWLVALVFCFSLFFAGYAPDIDMALGYFFPDFALGLPRWALHRGVTHSILMSPVWVYLCVLMMRAVGVRIRRRVYYVVCISHLIWDMALDPRVIPFGQPIVKWLTWLLCPACVYPVMQRSSPKAAFARMFDSWDKIIQRELTDPVSLSLIFASLVLAIMVRQGLIRLAVKQEGSTPP